MQTWLDPSLVVLIETTILSHSVTLWNELAVQLPWGLSQSGTPLGSSLELFLFPWSCNNDFKEENEDWESQAAARQICCETASETQSCEEQKWLSMDSEA